MTAPPKAKHTEIRFEDAIELALLASGFGKDDPGSFHAETALFPQDVVKYIKLSQPKNGSRY